MKRIVIITGNELRHDFFRKYIASETDVVVLKSYCEVPAKNLAQKMQEDENSAFRKEHLMMREQTEFDFFQVFCQKITDNSNPEFLTKGLINAEEKVNEIINLNPDIIISYGSSIIQAPLIHHFQKRFINIHLGLSPYYRGSGTNFFPFVNNEIACVGVTFMHIDAGIDTGEIIHQIRPTISYGDNLHQIGNRLIQQMTEVSVKLIHNFENTVAITPIKIHSEREKYYKKIDFSEESVATMYTNFSNGIVKNYIQNKEKLDADFPIIENPILV